MDTAFSFSSSKQDFAFYLVLGQPDHICYSLQTLLGWPAVIPSGRAREVIPDDVSGSCWGAITMLHILWAAVARGINTAFGQEIKVQGYMKKPRSPWGTTKVPEVMHAPNCRHAISHPDPKPSRSSPKQRRNMSMLPWHMSAPADP